MSSFASIFSLPSSAKVSTIYAFVFRIAFDCLSGFIIKDWPRTFTRAEASEIEVKVVAIEVISMIMAYLFICFRFLAPF